MQVVQRLREAGFQALLAGGAVRDMLLGVESYDYDVATDARPEDVRRLFRKVLLVGAQFGVAMVIHKGTTVEVTTFRSDLDYADGRRPEGVVYATPQQDARRRDFTINGMFYDPIAEKVIDYVGGQEDLQRGVIRTIGRPADRFGEDYLRMLRAVRFAARLGFEIDTETSDAIRRCAPRITAISGERICEELTKMLQRPSAATALTMLEELGLAGAILPELADDPHRWQRAVQRVGRMTRDRPSPSPDALAVFCGLLAELSAREISARVRRWGGSNELRKAAQFTARHLHDYRRAGEWPLATFKRLLADPYYSQLSEAWQAQADLAGETDALEAFHARRRAIDPARIAPPPLVTGRDLMGLGLAEGPQLGRILRELYTAQLNEQLADREAALTRARQMLDDSE